MICTISKLRYKNLPESVLEKKENVLGADETKICLLLILSMNINNEKENKQI